MSFNLLDSIKQEVTSTVIDKISNFLGESRGNTSNAVTAAIPTILAFLSEKSKSESSASNIVNLATDNSLSSLFQGNSFTDVYEKNRDSLMSTGNSMLISLFGDKEAKLSQEISDYSKISKESSDGILASITPLILSVLGSQISKQGLSASNLSGLFADQKDSIFSAIPSGLESVVGLLGLGAIGSKVSDTTSRVTSSVKDNFNNVKSTATAKADPVTKIYENRDDEKKGGFMKWLLPLLGIIAALAILYFLMDRCNDDKNAAVTDTEEVIVNDIDSTDVNLSGVDSLGEYDEATNRFIYNVGDEREIELADGTKLMVGSKSTEWKLYNFLTDENNKVSDDKTQGWFTLDRIYFETSSGNLDLTSRKQIDNMVAILKAYPNAHIKLGGYTDNSGSDDINIPLSTERANAVMKDLTNSGIDASRVEAEGYGSQHPICPANDTPTCMAQNRRVDVRVTAK